MQKLLQHDPTQIQGAGLGRCLMPMLEAWGGQHQVMVRSRWHDSATVANVRHSNYYSTLHSRARAVLAAPHPHYWD